MFSSAETKAMQFYGIPCPPCCAPQLPFGPASANWGGVGRPEARGRGDGGSSAWMVVTQRMAWSLPPKCFLGLTNTPPSGPTPTRRHPPELQGPPPLAHAPEAHLALAWRPFTLR
jgi:hypothetical protein